MRFISKLAATAAAITAMTATAFAGDIYISADAMIDTVAGKRVEKPAIIVRDHHIVAVGKQGRLDVPHDAEVVNLKGMTIMPGFMDMHVHLTVDAKASYVDEFSESIPRATVVGVRNAKRELMAGFTTVRDVGDRDYASVAIRDGIDAGDVIGPRVFASGPAMGITGGHCDNNVYPPEMHYRSEGVADGPWAARRLVREHFKYGRSEEHTSELSHSSVSRMPSSA